MLIGTVKPYNTYTINKRRLNREGFGKRLTDIIDVDGLKKEIADVLEKKGRVYGIYEKKELVGIYIFERQEDYFSKRESSVKLGKKEYDFDKFWYGESTTALYLKKCECLEEVDAYKEKIEKDLQEDLTDQIWVGQVAGVEWNDKLMYRKNLQKKSGQYWSAGAFSVMGIVLGWLIFQEFYMAILFGFMWGNVGVAIVDKTQMDTLDFVNKREVEADAIK